MDAMFGVDLFITPRSLNFHKGGYSFSDWSWPWFWAGTQTDRWTLWCSYVIPLRMFTRLNKWPQCAHAFTQRHALNGKIHDRRKLRSHKIHHCPLQMGREHFIIQFITYARNAASLEMCRTSVCPKSHFLCSNFKRSTHYTHWNRYTFFHIKIIEIE